MGIADIVEAIQAGRIRITDHADEEAEADGLHWEEIYFSVVHGEVIEEYPMDKPYPSCLINGQTLDGKPIHSVWAFNEDSRWVVAITVYRPDPKLWIEGWRRRK